MKDEMKEERGKRREERGERRDEMRDERGEERRGARRVGGGELLTIFLETAPWSTITAKSSVSFTHKTRAMGTGGFYGTVLFNGTVDVKTNHGISNSFVYWCSVV
jgi:hypothetical protein